MINLNTLIKSKLATRFTQAIFTVWYGRIVTIEEQNPKIWELRKPE